MKIFFAYLVLIPFSILWKGFVLAVLWGWFVVPKFGADPLTWAQAFGLSCLTWLSVYVYRHEPKDERSQVEKIIEGALAAFFFPLLCLGLGAAVKVFA